jgi:hypothetical protein
MNDQSSIALDTVVAQVEEIITSDIGGETVMMSLENSAYYGLDTIGSRIWELIAQPVSVSSLCNTLQTEFEVERDACCQDVLELLTRLHEEHLIQIVTKEHS